MTEHVYKSKEKKFILSFDFDEKLDIGSDVCFVLGRKNKPVAYTSLGKVILCKHNIPLGYAKVKTVDDKGNYYLVTANHIVKDIYSGINYEDFIKVLLLFGYKIGFDRIFINPYWNNEEHQIFAYNLETKVCIVAETFTDCGRGRVGFNSIDIYLPGKSVFDFDIGRNRLVSRGSGCMTVFRACGPYGDNRVLCLVDNIMNDVKESAGEIKRPQNDSPSLWTYADESTDKDGKWILGDSTIQRLKLAPAECLSIFKGCNFLNKLC